MGIKVIALLGLVAVCCAIPAPSSGKAKRFDGGEHRFLGDSVGPLPLVNADANGNIVMTRETVNFKNGASDNMYSYGFLVGFFGDYVGPTSVSEIFCKADPAKAEGVFFDVFNDFWDSYWSSQTYVNNVKNIFDIEDDAVKTALAAGKRPYEAFVALGGGRFQEQLGLAKYVESVNMQNFNDDHIGECGRIAYKIAHTAAQNAARKAGASIYSSTFATLSTTQKIAAVKTAKDGLLRAYALNAFADHILTDSFAGGHMRPPRTKLAEFCVSQKSWWMPEWVARLNGGQAVLYMHGEDNRNAIKVTNKRGDVWTAYGDMNLFDDRNKRNMELIKEATALSVSDVFSAFTGAVNKFSADVVMPDLSQINKFQDENTCPMWAPDPSNPQALLIRDPIYEVRPNSWLKARGLPVNPLNKDQPGCYYRKPTPEESCPSAIGTAYNLFNTKPLTLFYRPEREAWTQAYEAPPQSFSEEEASAFQTTGLFEDQRPQQYDFKFPGQEDPFKAEEYLPFVNGEPQAEAYLPYVNSEPKVEEYAPFINSEPQAANLPASEHPAGVAWY
eukprot:Colp12_sorted_trinity150504_noHs@14592